MADDMAGMQHEPIIRVWGQSPQ